MLISVVYDILQTQTSVYVNMCITAHVVWLYHSEEHLKVIPNYSVRRDGVSRDAVLIIKTGVLCFL
jgi:hypothetical protein